MKKIKQLAGMIRDELEDGCGYAKEALFYKDSDRELAEMFYRLANEEMNHANAEHDQAVRLIKANTAEAPTAMQAVWDWEHKNYIEDMAEIKVMLSMYKS